MNKCLYSLDLVNGNGEIISHLVIPSDETLTDIHLIYADEYYKSISNYKIDLVIEKVVKYD